MGRQAPMETEMQTETQTDEIQGLVDATLSTYGNSVARRIAYAILAKLASAPLWRALPEDVQETLAIGQRETVGESTKDIALAQLDEMGPHELAFLALLDSDLDPDDEATQDAWIAAHLSPETLEEAGYTPDE